MINYNKKILKKNIFSEKQFEANQTKRYGDSQKDVVA